jgi:16S rRNA (cytidine1402-2'-O)-methyltransferase
MPGTLHLVATPIGNRGDLSPRAIETLRTVALVLCEDTRHSAPLLAWAGISTTLWSYHAHNEATQVPAVLARLQAGDDVALVSDAGTPLLSDPGERLVRAAIDAGVRVTTVPGPSALLAALTASGLPALPFTCLGFLPRAAGERAAVLRSAVNLPHTVVLYESPNRLADLLTDLAAEGGGAREAVVARELTKLHEELRRGTVSALATYYEESPPRGEIVVVLAGRAATGPDTVGAAERAATLRAAGVSVRDTVTRLQEEFGVPRNEAYKLASEA